MFFHSWTQLIRGSSLCFRWGLNGRSPELDIWRKIFPVSENIFAGRQKATYQASQGKVRACICDRKGRAGQTAQTPGTFRFGSHHFQIFGGIKIQWKIPSLGQNCFDEFISHRMIILIPIIIYKIILRVHESRKMIKFNIANIHDCKSTYRYAWWGNTHTCTQIKAGINVQMKLMTWKIQDEWSNQVKTLCFNILQETSWE